MYPIFYLLKGDYTPNPSHCCIANVRGSLLLGSRVAAMLLLRRSQRSITLRVGLGSRVQDFRFMRIRGPGLRIHGLG